MNSTSQIQSHYQSDYVESIFLTSHNRDLSQIFDTNGRFAICSASGLIGNTTITFADLFHGETKEITISPHANYGKIRFIKMIGEHHLFMNTSNGSSLLKINLETWEISVVSNPDPKSRWIYDVIFASCCNFLIYYNMGFVTGSLIDDEIVFSPRLNFYFGSFKCTNLAGNQLCGLRYMGDNATGVWMWQYCKIDLATLTEETIDVPFDPSNNVFLGYLTCNYFQIETRFYVAFYGKNRQTHIYAFNIETLTWENTGIVVCGIVRSLFVDQNEILTFHTFDYYSEKSTFYRFALKKPDSLKNLAWLKIRRSAVLFNSKLYEKIRPRLPYGRGLRSLFVSDFY